MISTSAAFILPQIATRLDIVNQQCHTERVLQESIASSGRPSPTCNDEKTSLSRWIDGLSNALGCDAVVERSL